LTCDLTHVTTIISIEENDVQDRMRSNQTDSDEVSSKYSRFVDILSFLVTIFSRENKVKLRFGWNVITMKYNNII